MKLIYKDGWSDFKIYVYCVVPENIQTPTREGMDIFCNYTLLFMMQRNIECKSMSVTERRLSTDVFEPVVLG